MRSRNAPIFRASHSLFDRPLSGATWFPLREVTDVLPIAGGFSKDAHTVETLQMEDPATGLTHTFIKVAKTLPWFMKMAGAPHGKNSYEIYFHLRRAGKILWGIGGR